MASGQIRYPEPIDPDRVLSAKIPESIRFARLEKIRTQRVCAPSIGSMSVTG
jgi:hypothetical protein